MEGTVGNEELADFSSLSLKVDRSQGNGAELERVTKEVVFSGNTRKAWLLESQASVRASRRRRRKC